MNFPLIWTRAPFANPFLYSTRKQWKLATRFSTPEGNTKRNSVNHSEVLDMCSISAWSPLVRKPLFWTPRFIWQMKRFRGRQMGRWSSGPFFSSKNLGMNSSRGNPQLERGVRAWSPRRSLYSTAHLSRQTGCGVQRGIADIIFLHSFKQKNTNVRKLALCEVRAREREFSFLRNCENQ